MKNLKKIIVYNNLIINVLWTRQIFFLKAKVTFRPLD